MINPQQNCSTTSKADEQIINNIPVVPSSSSEESTKTHHSDDGQQHHHHHHHYHYHHQQVDDLKLLQADQSSTHSVEVITKQEGEPAVKMVSTDSIVSSAVRSPPPADLSGREKLKRHRIEVAGRVWIPDLWGQEEFLKDWIDCSAFDSSLFPNGIMSARAALVEEGRRANSRIGNRCS